MIDVAVVPLRDQRVGRVRHLLFLLLGSVGFLQLGSPNLLRVPLADDKN
jgi:hypothetical protein